MPYPVISIFVFIWSTTAYLLYYYLINFYLPILLSFLFSISSTRSTTAPTTTTKSKMQIPRRTGWQCGIFGLEATSADCFLRTPFASRLICRWLFIGDNVYLFLFSAMPDYNDLFPENFAEDDDLFRSHWENDVVKLLQISVWKCPGAISKRI